MNPNIEKARKICEKWWKEDTGSLLELFIPLLADPTQRVMTDAEREVVAQAERCVDDGDACIPLRERVNALRAEREPKVRYEVVGNGVRDGLGGQAVYVPFPEATAKLWNEMEAKS